MPPSGFQFDVILMFARAPKYFYKITPLRRFQVVLTQILLNQVNSLTILCFTFVFVSASHCHITLSSRTGPYPSPVVSCRVANPTLVSFVFGHWSPIFDPLVDPTWLCPSSPPPNVRHEDQLHIIFQFPPPPPTCPGRYICPWLQQHPMSGKHPTIICNTI